jgi:DMSO/TMAO reductase YedYZ molybdopterin-dependent catalytic subunit
LTIDGEVERPLTLTLDDVKGFDRITAVRTLECAGNGRSFFNPKTPGAQWGGGAVGTARYEGVRLVDILQRARIRSTGKHVLFNGADEPPLPTAPDFVRSIPLEKALHPDTLLVYTMNGEPLPPVHGYPLRVIPAGWIGAACVKWLVNIRVLPQAHDGHFMVNGYRIPKSPVTPGEKVEPKEMVSLSGLEVKSLITMPPPDASVPAGRVLITGAAWAGEADIARVDVSVDFGRTWQPARLGSEQNRYAWRLWEYDWTAHVPGSYLILARATDSAGRTQPIEQIWNPSGYLWNVIDRVRVNVLKG